ncbi:MAG: class I SAM-dependent methyltransferase [Planctomycetes bacterium]|nr:class I SAM-dependent methyltransferase [Planctomycetota bacterium]
MKIQLCAPTLTRVPYTACPLCSGTAWIELRRDDCTSHPLYQPDLPATIGWLGCETCGHVFTEGWFDDEASARLMERANPLQLASAAAEEHRITAARLVQRVSVVRGALGGRWLDVGFGNGALLTTAEEFGYEAVGLDLRGEGAAELQALGYDARLGSLADLDASERFDVISFADVLEHTPFPAETLTAAAAHLAPGGLLFVSMPNVDSYPWKVLDRKGANPYWTEIEHYHNFSREHLYWLLRRTGFEPCDYAVSERYRAGMEVIAVRLGDES